MTKDSKFSSPAQPKQWMTAPWRSYSNSEPPGGVTPSKKQRTGSSNRDHFKFILKCQRPFFQAPPQRQPSGWPVASWEFSRYGRKFRDWTKCYSVQFSSSLLNPTVLQALGRGWGHRVGLRHILALKELGTVGQTMAQGKYAWSIKTQMREEGWGKGQDCLFQRGDPKLNSPRNVWAKVNFCTL